MNLLNRAKKFIQGSSAPPAKPHYYNVSCVEGHRLSGVRTEGYQALRCPTCGEGIFILPRSPLPEPPSPASEQRRGSRAAAAPPPMAWADEPVTLADPPPMAVVNPPADEQEIEWADEMVAEEEEAAPPVSEPRPSREPAEEPTRPRPAGKPRPVARPADGARAPAAPGSQPRHARSAPARPAARTVEPPTPVIAEKLEFKEWARRRRTPLIFSGAAVIVALTVAYGAWQASRANQPHVAMIGRTDGLKALDEGRFDTAHQLLSRAKRAVEILHGQVEGADEIKKGAEEAEIFANLASDSLESMLGQAKSSDPAEWDREFSRSYKGTAVIIDATVMRVPDSSGGNYDLDYRIVPNTSANGNAPPSLGRIDTSGLVLFDRLRPRAGEKVLFGARLAAFEFDRSREEWVIRLVPESGVQISHLKALYALGWPELETPTGEAVQ